MCIEDILFSLGQFAARTRVIGIVLEQAVPFQTQHTEHRLTEYSRIHLAGAKHPIDENDRHLLERELVIVDGKLHLYLERFAA